MTILDIRYSETGNDHQLLVLAGWLTLAMLVVSQRLSVEPSASNRRIVEILQRSDDLLIKSCRRRSRCV